MGNCTSSMEALPIESVKGMAEGKMQELFTKALSSKEVAEDELEKLISSKINVNQKFGHEMVGECHPLHLATKSGNLKAVQLLLKADADPNLCDGKGQTPLYWAVDDSQTEVIDELLKANADPSICSEKGTAPLNLAIENNKQDLVNKLIQGGAAVNAEKGEPPLVTAVKENHIDIIMLLLKAEASPVGLTFQFPEGETFPCLHTWASSKGHEEIAVWLETKFPPGQKAAVEVGVEEAIKERTTTREGGDGAEEVTHSGETPLGNEQAAVTLEVPEDNAPVGDGTEGEPPEEAPEGKPEESKAVPAQDSATESAEETKAKKEGDEGERQE